MRSKKKTKAPEKAKIREIKKAEAKRILKEIKAEEDFYYKQMDERQDG